MNQDTMNDELNIGECPHCHGIVDHFGPLYQCRSCHAYGPSLQGLQEYTGNWDDLTILYNTKGPTP